MLARSKLNSMESNMSEEFQRLVMVKQCYYQTVLYVMVKDQDLLKKKKQVDYHVV